MMEDPTSSSDESSGPSPGESPVGLLLGGIDCLSILLNTIILVCIGRLTRCFPNEMLILLVTLCFYCSVSSGFMFVVALYFSQSSKDTPDWEQKMSLITTFMPVSYHIFLCAIMDKGATAVLRKRNARPLIKTLFWSLCCANVVVMVMILNPMASMDYSKFGPMTSTVQNKPKSVYGLSPPAMLGIACAVAQLISVVTIFILQREISGHPIFTCSSLRILKYLFPQRETSSQDSQDKIICGDYFDNCRDANGKVSCCHGNRTVMMSASDTGQPVYCKQHVDTELGGPANSYRIFSLPPSPEVGCSMETEKAKSVLPPKFQRASDDLLQVTYPPKHVCDGINHAPCMVLLPQRHNQDSLLLAAPDNRLVTEPLASRRIVHFLGQWALVSILLTFPSAIVNIVTFLCKNKFKTEVPTSLKGSQRFLNAFLLLCLPIFLFFIVIKERKEAKRQKVPSCANTHNGMNMSTSGASCCGMGLAPHDGVPPVSGPRFIENERETRVQPLPGFTPAVYSVMNGGWKLYDNPQHSSPRCWQSQITSSPAAKVRCTQPAAQVPASNNEGENCKSGCRSSAAAAQSINQSVCTADTRMAPCGIANVLDECDCEEFHHEIDSTGRLHENSSSMNKLDIITTEDHGRGLHQMKRLHSANSLSRFQANRLEDDEMHSPLCHDSLKILMQSRV